MTDDLFTSSSFNWIMILMMVLLSVMIKTYKYFISSKKYSFKGFILTVWKDLISDIIIIICLTLIDVYIISLHPAVMLFGVVLSDTILHWFFKNQRSVVSKVMSKLLDYILSEIKKNKDDEISTQ